MGAKVSKPSRSKRESKALVVSSKFATQKSSIIEAMKPQCLRKRKVIKNNGIKRITKVSKLTLKDWLLASPCSHPSELKGCFNGGELYVFKHSFKRVHPTSSSREIDDVHLSSNTDVSGSSFSKSQSGKSKKKVRFRLPEEADIRLFYSPLALGQYIPCKGIHA